MATEPSATYPGSWEEATNFIIGELLRRVWDWLIDHIWIAALLLLLLYLFDKMIVPALSELFKKWMESRQNGQQGKDKIISNLTVPRPDYWYEGKTLPDELERLTNKIESQSRSKRYPYCVVCPDKDLVVDYAGLFFKRMEKAANVDKLGWVTYQRPRGENLELCAKHCMICDLTLENDIDSIDKRFHKQCEYFKESNRHSMLVFHMLEDAKPDDTELRQLAALPGLSMVLFATSPVEGYKSIVISKKGGRSE